MAEGFDLKTAMKAQDFDPAKIEDLDTFDAAELVQEWRKSRPGLFKPGETPNEAAGAATQPIVRKVFSASDASASRGARDTASERVSYTKATFRDPDWQEKNPALASALSRNDGSAVLEE